MFFVPHHFLSFYIDLLPPSPGSLGDPYNEANLRDTVLRVSIILDPKFYNVSLFQWIEGPI